MKSIEDYDVAHLAQVLRYARKHPSNFETSENECVEQFDDDDAIDLVKAYVLYINNIKENNEN